MYTSRILQIKGMTKIKYILLNIEKNHENILFIKLITPLQ